MPLRIFLALGIACIAPPSPARADLCADPGGTCTAKMPPACLDKWGAGALPAGDACAPAVAAYRDCLASVAEKCGAPAAPAREAEAERAYNAVKDSKDAALLEIIAKRYPNTVWGQIAARQAEALRPAAAQPAPAPPSTAPAATKPAAARSKPGDTFRDCPICPEMVEIPGGSFLMGSPESEPERGGDEGPQRRIRIQPFAMGKYEVTFAEWDACVADGGCDGYRPRDRGWGRGRRPVITVSWSHAQAYVRWLNRKVGENVYRLPSESEWEYAARAGTTTPFWWGSSITTDQANYAGTGSYNGSPTGVDRKRTVAVGSFAANPFGLHDVHGNVWEWVQDCWNAGGYLRAPSHGSAWMSGECFLAVIRGGSWYDNPRLLRSAFRSRDGRDGRDYGIGFRLARDSRTLGNP